MSEPCLRLDRGADVARLTLNRPDKRNALTREFIGEIAAAVDAIAADSNMRLLILAAEGPAFCAGMDLQQMQDRATQPNASQLWREDTRAYRDLLVALYSLPIPTVAAVSGPALAGGLGLVLACDIVVASDNAYFSLPEPKRGITAAVVTPLLIYRVGPGNATYILLSGRNVAATDALRMGLCHELVEQSSLSPRVDDLSQSILSGAPESLAISKQQIARYAGTANDPGSFLFSQLEAGMAASADARESEDAREGLASFLEKRRPKWERQ